MKQRIISFLLAVLMTATILPVQAWGATVVDSGTCGGEGDGSNLTWTLDSDGLLTIDGKGEMSNWNSSSSAPWDTHCSKIKRVVIGNGVTSIGDFAFSGCSSLTSITIPDSVTVIGYAAFEDCSSLTSITIPDSVTSIGGEAFYHCSSLTSITIPDSVTSIGRSTFSHCSSLTGITIPNSVTSIGSWAFNGCSSLTSVIIPDSVTSIGGRGILSLQQPDQHYHPGQRDVD